MADIRHISCPKCGGTLGLSGMDRLVKCRYCGTTSLVEAPGHAPEYYVDPRVQAVTARRTLQRVLMESDVPAGLLKRARFHSARLYFIPFHEVNARRVGTMKLTEFKPEKRPRQSSRAVSMGQGATVSIPRVHDDWAVPKTKVVDTRVIMNDLTRVEPAVSLPEWHVEEADVQTARAGETGLLKAMDRRRVEKLGRIYKPTITPDQMLSRLDADNLAANVEDNTEIVEVRIKRIYYPVWRVRYEYQGRLYGAAIDGVTGKIMSARAPETDKYRVVWLLGTAAMVSFFAGKIARVIATLAMGDHGGAEGLVAVGIQGSIMMIPVILIALLAVFFVLGVGWDQFRYAGEIVTRGDKKMVERINRPKKTFFDKARDSVSRMLEDFMKKAETNARWRT